MSELVAAILFDAGSYGGGLDIFPPAVGCEELTKVNNVSGQAFTFANFH
jgi:hypothetical protein